MTTPLAFWIFLIIAAFFVLDHYVWQTDALVFLGKRGIDLINYLAIWR